MMNPLLLPWFAASSTIISAVVICLREDHPFPFALSPGMRYILATLLGGVQAIIMAAQHGVSINEACATAAASTLVAIVAGAPRQIVS